MLKIIVSMAFKKVTDGAGCVLFTAVKNLVTEQIFVLEPSVNV